MSKKKGHKPPSKATLALLEQLKRKRGTRDLEKRFLIVCEDHKSAPSYFHALKKHFNLSAASIAIVGSGHATQPTQVVEVALKLKLQAQSPQSGTESFDQVWCIIDGDYGVKIANARSKALANDIQLAITTPCFEYWVLLHCKEYNTAHAKCQELVRVLKKELRDYEKGSYDFSKIIPEVYTAARRARQSRTAGKAYSALPEDQNPCSEIYLLISALGI